MLCLAAAGLVVSLPVVDFTLAWEHTVERIEWQEDYRLTPEGLVLTEARIQGNGAGMEPGEGAVLEGGWWRWRPDRPPLPELVLARSGVGEWRICWAGEGCRALDSLIQAKGPMTLAVCG
jgi:hypothetical protein